MLELTTKSKVAVTFDGIDGAGKSELSRRLCDALQALHIQTGFVGAHAALCGSVASPPTDPFLNDTACDLARRIWSRPWPERHHELGYGYWLGLVSAYYRCLQEAVIPAVASLCDVVIVENWCHKFAARLQLKGYAPAALRSALPQSSNFDRVFLLDVPPALAWQRLGQGTYLEMGGQDGHPVLGRESFVEYQGRLRDILTSEGASRTNWLSVPNHGEIDATVAVLVTEVCRLLGIEAPNA